MKIAFFDTDSIPVDEARALEALVGYDVTFVGGPLNEETAATAADADIVSVFVSSSVPASVIDALPKLRHIAARSTGLDHIDTAHAKEKGIGVSNVAGYGEHTVAEFAFAMILGLSRHIAAADTALKSGARYRLVDFKGFDLFGKTIAVLGTGKIGKRVVSIAKGFGMDVVLFDAYPDQAFAEAAGAQYLALEEALAAADIVSLHVPSLPDTRHLMNEARFARMKQGAYLINTARGDVVDPAELLQALDSGRLAGAALDVMEAEKLRNDADQTPEEATKIDTDRRLIANPRVLVTPHIAFCSNEAIDLIDRTSLDSIKQACGDK
jgi:D-lactate dehydrogenase